MSVELINTAIPFAAGCIVAGTCVYFYSHGKLAAKQKELKIAFEKNQQLIEELKKDLNTAKQEVSNANSELALRESEIDIIGTYDRDSAVVTNSEKLFSLTADTIERRFGREIYSVGILKFTNPGFEIKVAGHDPKVLDAIIAANLGKQCLDANNPMLVSPETVPGLSELVPDVKRVSLLPVICDNRKMGVIALLLLPNSVPQTLRLCRKISESLSRTLYRLIAYEQERASSRLDLLTGLPNNRYLAELMPHVIDRSSVERPSSMILIETDDLKEINDKYGHLVADQFVKALAETIQRGGRLDNNVVNDDHVLRYGDFQFIVLMEDTGSEQACQIAERLRTAIQKRQDWPGGIPKASISLGIVTIPEENDDADTILAKAEVALMYSKEKMGRHQWVHFNEVPRNFKAARLSAKLGGDLGLFDPFWVLQSMSKADKTGILTVDDPTGKKFWAFFEKGKVIKARMGQLRGDHAVAEFVTMFEDGKFEFQEYASLDASTMPDLDDTFNTKKDLDKAMLNGALAQEQLASARRLIGGTRLFVKSVEETANVVAILRKEQDQITRDEMEVMVAICKLASGRLMLQQIFERLENVPTYLMWHCTARLIELNVIKLSKLAVYAI